MVLILSNFSGLGQNINSSHAFFSEFGEIFQNSFLKEHRQRIAIETAIVHFSPNIQWSVLELIHFAIFYL